jgi:esterase/lipase superfamily enzyme
MIERAQKLLVVTLCALVLGACGGNRSDVFAPLSEPVPGTQRVNMFVATTRDPAKTPAELFTGERGDNLSIAEVAVSIPPEKVRAAGEVAWPKATPGDPEREFAVLKANVLHPSQVRERVRQRLVEDGGRKKGKVLLFIHGYNNRFADAVMRFAQISNDSGTPALPVLFTWPSRGTALAYGFDRESANYSRDALELVIRALNANPQVGEIDVLAHSMGAWVTIEALRQIAIRDGRLPPKIKNVIAAAPDVDVDVFGMQIARMGKPRPLFTVFTSQDDRALAFSRRLWGGMDRLGQIDASVEPLNSQLAAQGVQVFDLTKMRGNDNFNHGKFAESPDVVRFIGQRLVEGHTLDDNNPTLGEHFASLTTRVGTVAGMVLATPLQVLDPAANRTFGNQLTEALGAVERGETVQLRGANQFRDFEKDGAGGQPAQSAGKRR